MTIEIEEGITHKTRINFDIDVPKDIEESNMNTLIYQVSDLRFYLADPMKDTKIINAIIEKIKQTLDNMKYIEIK